MSKFFRKAFLFGWGSLVFLALSVSLIKPLSATFYGENPGPGLHEHQIKNGNCLVYLPKGFDPNRRYPLVVLSHVAPNGMSDVDPDAFLESWSKQADLRGYIVALPLAGGVFVLIDDWYKEALETVKMYYPVDPRKVLLTGFGAGAHYAIHFGATYPEQFTGVSPVAGTLDGWWRTMIRFKKGNRPQFYFLGGAQDRVVPAAKVQETAKDLEEKGYSVRFEELQDLGHSYTDEVTLKVADWFDSLPKKTIE